MLIKKPYTGTRLGLGDVDLVQPLNTEHPLLRGVQGFWLALPHLSGGTRLYNLIQPRGTGVINGAAWRDFSEVPRSGLHYDGSSFVDTGVERIGSTGLFASASEEYTVITEARVQPDGLGSVLARGVSSFSARTFHMHFNQDEETPQVVIRGQSNFTDAALDDGRFHSHAVTWDGSAATYIVDGGSLVLPLGVGNQSENTGQRIVFAARTNGTGFRLNGDQTYVLIADRAYSPQEVASFYDQARRGFPDLLNRRPSMTVVDMASVGEVIQIAVTDNITTSDNTEGRAKASAFAPSGITLDSLVNAVATAREIAADTMTVDELIPAYARAGGSVEEQTAATDVKFGLIDEFLSFLIENGLISEETLADISAVSATEEEVTLVDITSARSILFEEIAELSETNDAAVAVMKSLGLTREDVLFGDEVIPSIGDVIIAALQSTFFTETRALGTAEMLDVIASSAALEDTVISKVISVVGNVIEENATFGTIASARMIAAIRSLEDVVLNEIVEARSLTRGFIGETLAFDDAVQFRLIDKLWLTARISVELKILTESIDIKPKR